MNYAYKELWMLLAANSLSVTFHMLWSLATTNVAAFGSKSKF